MSTASVRLAAAAAVLIGISAGGARMAHALCLLHMATVATAPTSHAATDGPAAGSLALGRGTALALAPIETLHFPARPEKTVGPYGGLFFVDVPRAGAYRVSLGARAWIDVAEGRTTIASVAHGPGRACSGAAKEVTFPITAGRHAIEITASDAPTLALMIASAE